MTETKTVNVETTNARASTTLTDTTPTVPLADLPQGLMVVGPQVTLHFVEGEWSKANSYDYYDVVRVDGTSYIAVQDVPANTEITDTEYWAKWNDPNAQMELLQDTVYTFDRRITSATETANAALTSANSKAPVNHASANTTYGIGTTANYGHLKITDELTNAGASTGTAASAKSLYEYATANRRHLVIIGDSFTDTNTREYAWPSYMTEFTVHNYAKSGAGFVDQTSTPRTFPVQLNTAISDVAFDNSDVCAVIVYGGINDFLHGSSATTVSSVMSQMYDTITENFVNAKPIIVFMNAPNTAKETRWTLNGVTLYLADVIKGDNRRPIIPGNNILVPYTPSTVFDADNIHPNATGMRVIAGFMRAAIYGYYNRMRYDMWGPQTVTRMIDYNGNFMLRGMFTLETGTVGDNTVNIGINEGQYKLFNDVTVIPVPYACSNPNVTSVYLAPNTGLIHVICSQAVSNVNIYL